MSRKRLFLIIRHFFFLKRYFNFITFFSAFYFRYARPISFRPAESWKRLVRVSLKIYLISTNVNELSLGISKRGIVRTTRKRPRNISWESLSRSEHEHSGVFSFVIRLLWTLCSPVARAIPYQSPSRYKGSIKFNYSK